MQLVSPFSQSTQNSSLQYTAVIYIVLTILVFCSLPCEGGVKYLHRNPASRRRRRKGESRIWESKIWSRVLRDSEPRMRWRGPTAVVNDRPVLSSERERPASTNPHLSDSNINLVLSPRWVLIPIQTDRRTVGRNIRLDSTQYSIHLCSACVMAVSFGFLQCYG
jgi:hypothetical protein